MKINITPMKRFALDTPQLPRVLRELMISEPDYMDVNEFCIKAEVWLRLTRILDERLL
ncbi:MAG: hypothetical protein V1836_02485 [Candidatus Aenigmatarchaeota archaeon]